MAKKKSNLEEELEKLDYMEILSGGESKGIFSKNDVIDYSYQTGITLIDYAYGYEINVRDENDMIISKRKCLGLQAGSFNVVTGKTQSFKTTLSMQMIANIAYANNGNVYHYDCENRLVIERAKTMTKLPNNWFTGDNPRYALRSGAIGFDTLQNDITTIYENKIRAKSVLLRDTGVVDCNNKPIWLMPPTVVFVDSLQNILQEELKYDINNKNFDDNKELRGNMVGAQSAKTIRGFLTDIIPMLKEANIIMLVIAHKTSNMSLQPFAGVAKQFQYGSANERISGGTAVEFNASAVINLTGLSKEDSRFHMSSDGFEGNTVLFEPTKSSTNESGNEKTGMGFLLIVDKQNDGIDNIRSLITFMNQRGRLKGNRAGYKVIDKQGNELTEKFTWKNVYKEFNENKDMYRTFMLNARDELETLIAKSPDNNGKITVFNPDAILSELQAA